MKNLRGDLIPMTMAWSRVGNFPALLQPVFLITNFIILMLWQSPLIANDNSHQPPLSCLSYVQLSLPQSGETVLGPQLFLAGNYPNYDIFTVDIVGPLTNIIGCDQIGESLMVKVMDNQGNSCWSNLSVEDKSWPNIQCEDIEILCNQDISTEDYSFFINVSDNCTPNENLNIYYNESLDDHYCDPDYVATIHRTWFVSDQYGNQNSCSQSIRFTRLDINDTDFPDDTTVSCVNPDLNPANTGEPMINGTPIIDFCEIIKWKSDQQIPLPCQGEYKVVRTWNVMDWCSQQTVTKMQEIEVLDEIGPSMACPDDLTISVDQDDCHATFTIPDITVTDLCSNDETIVTTVQVNSIFGFEEGDISNLDLGNNIIIYTSTDACGNSNTCDVNVYVVDNVAPILDCSSPVQIPLGDNDLVTVFATAFQFYFFDNCGINSVQIRKLNDTCGNPDDLVFGDQVTFCCADAGGTVSVELTVSDIFGNANSCIFQVDVKDGEAPTVTCRDITIQLDEQGNFELDPGNLVLIAEDNCGLQDTMASITNFECFHVGNIPVDITVTDIDGNIGTCEAIVTVQDVTAPQAICQDVTIELNDLGMYVLDPLLVDNMSFDACGIASYALDVNMFTCVDVAEQLNPVVLTVTDENDNSSSCTANVTVLDVSPPDCHTQDITVTIETGNSINILADQVNMGSSDLCSDVTISVSPDNFTCDNLGQNEVILSVTDASGNLSICTATVVVKDLIAPNCMAKDITVMLDDMGMVSITGTDVDNGSDDDCGLVVGIDVSPNSFGCVNVGPNPVILTVTDNNGNQSTCTATVTVEDNVPPDCMARDITITLDGNGQLTITPDQINNNSTDLCGIISNLSLDLTMFDCTHLGDNPVVLTVTDDSGNQSACNAMVTVKDTIAPVCMTQDVTLYVDEFGLASLAVIDVDNGSVDTCGTLVDLQVSPSNFDCSNVNMLNITTLTLTDDNGNVSSCDANVVVLDTIDPICNIMNIIVELDEFGEAAISGNDLDMGSSDNCMIVSMISQPNTFLCNDIGANSVIVTVIDQSGNLSTCAAIVQVDDVIDPTITCPGDTIVECTEDFSNLNIFGVPDALDECGISSLVEDVNMTTNACNIGVIIRTFSVEDNDGNENFCQQFITVNPPQNPLTLGNITWPPMVVNATTNCTSLDPDMLPGGPPIVDESNVDCSLVTITYEDMTSSGGCACAEAVNRTWTVVDSCTYNPINMNGVFTFIQTINVVDDEVPILILPANVDTVLAPVDCDAFIDLVDATSLDCNDVTITNDSQFALSGGVNASGTYDVGVTTVTFTATDCCGLSTNSSITITVQDTLAPIINCETQYLAEIEVDDQVTIIPADLLISVEDNCIDSIDLNYSFSFSDPNVSSLQFICGELGPHLVNVYVMDGFGNVDSCLVTVTVADPMSFCTMGRLADLGGAIFIENGVHMIDVKMKLGGYMSSETSSDPNGNYMFEDLIMHQGYLITPEFEDNWMNGVSAWDMVLIQRHILGLERLDSPYKMIAADINNSKSISAGDLVVLKKLILGLGEEISNNKPWRFIHSQYEFLDIHDPLKDNFTENLQVEFLQDDIYNANFIAIKSGDVNNTAQPYHFSSSEIRSGLVQDVVVFDKQVQKGEYIEFNLSLKEDFELSALQFGLRTHGLTIKSIRTDVGIELLNGKDFVFNDETGELRLLWTDAFSHKITRDENILVIEAEAIKSGKMSEMIEILNSEFPSILYDPFGREAAIELKFRKDEVIAGLSNVKSIPNPFSDKINVQFELRENENVQISIIDALGRMIKSASIDMRAGKNNIVIQSDELSGPGVYHIQLRTKTAEITTRIMHIK